MGASGQDIDLRVLLREIGWLRRLAATLVSDGSRADDLTQETLVVALQRRPWMAGAASLRPWLSAVARKIVRRGLRDTANREELERRVVTARVAGGAPDLVDRVDLQRKLVEAVLGIAEPYRSAVLLRYFEDLSAHEIASRQSCNAEVARQRVSRGLSMLRARLDRTFGADRRAWCAIFVSRFALRSPIGSSTAGSGVLASATAIGGGLMTAKTVGVGIALAVLGALAWFGFHEARVDSRDSRLTGVVDGSSARKAPNSSIAEVSPAEPVAAGSTPLEASERVVAGTELGTTLRGTVHDAHGNGIPDVSIRLEELPPAVHLNAHGLLMPSSEPDRNWTCTDRNGAFEWKLDKVLAVDKEHWLQCDHQDFFAARVAVDLAHDTHVILVARPVIEGQFYDPERHPVGGPAEAWVQMRRTNEEIQQFRMEVEPDGKFHSHGLPEGDLDLVHGRVQGFAKGYVHAKRSLAAEDRLTLDIVLTQGRRIRGVVLDELSREPIPDATVFAEAEDPTPGGVSPTTITDSLGRFELQGVAASTFEISGTRSMTEVLEIEARKDGYTFPKAWRDAIRLPPSRQGEELIENVEVFLQPASTRVTLRLSHPGGEPVTQEFAVQALYERGERFEARRENEDRHVFDRLPEGNACIVAHTLRGTPEDQRFFASTVVEIGAEEDRDVNLVLDRAGAVIEGTIRSGDGSPIAGVELRGWSQFPFSQQSYGMDVWTATTDVQGHYSRT
jgi:RNA polymerase sigma-70 factor (ECF subfamily)